MLNYLKAKSLATMLRISLTFIPPRLHLLNRFLVCRLQLLVTHLRKVKIHIIFQLLPFFTHPLMLPLTKILTLLFFKMNLAPDHRLIQGFPEPV